MAMPSCWTAEMTEKGRDLWLAGKPYGFIAKELGVSSSVVFKYGKQVWPPREEKKSEFQWAKEEEDKLRELVSLGQTITEIIKVIPRADKSLRVKIEKLGLEYLPRSYGWTEEQDNLIREKYNKCPSVSELASVLGKAEQTVATRAAFLGVRRNRAEHLSQNYHGTSEGAKKRWSKPESRHAASQAMKKRWEGEEFRKNIKDKAHKFFESPDNRLARSLVCREARLKPEVIEKLRKVQKNGSSIERIVWRLLEGLGLKEGIDWEKHFQIGYYQIDVMVRRPGRKSLLIECQGDYWHTLDRVIRTDAAKKTYIEEYFSADYDLVYLWEHEFLFEGKIGSKLKRWIIGNTDVVKDFEFSQLAVKSVNIDTARQFVENYHYLSNLGRGGVFIGCYLGEELVAVTVFSHQVRQTVAGSLGVKGNELLELSRFVISPEHQKQNLGSWFMSRAIGFLKELVPAVKMLVSYSDEGQGHTGALYKASGWDAAGEVRADYWYVDNEGFVTGKQAAYKMARKMSKTEAEYVEEMGWKKIYGLEKLRFTKKL